MVTCVGLVACTTTQPPATGPQSANDQRDSNSDSTDRDRVVTSPEVDSLQTVSNHNKKSSTLKDIQDSTPMDILEIVGITAAVLVALTPMLILFNLDKSL